MADMTAADVTLSWIWDGCVVCGGGGEGKRRKELPDPASRVLLPSCTRRPRVLGAEAWRRDHGFYTFIGWWHDLTVASLPSNGNGSERPAWSYHRSGGRKFPRVSPPDLPPCFETSHSALAGSRPRLVSRGGRTVSQLHQMRRRSSNRLARPTPE